MARFDFAVLEKTSTQHSRLHETPHADGEVAAGDMAQPPEVSKAYFTPEEAAAYMHLSVEAFRVLAADPKLQPVRVSDTYLYRVADIQRFLFNMD